MDVTHRYGSDGFATAEEAEADAVQTITMDDFVILKMTPKDTGNPVVFRRTTLLPFAWVWPPEYGRSFLSDSIVNEAYTYAEVSR